ncbi:hypothetical protein SE17_06310 [Kouleothrix aurantiaca]|uniref:histidine kinase n=1 Tax=Kouleothrix aurantiaca TaxID=186479 RepID=A0A0P9DV82_9CHLR|nr:hypothetical protein SE17_06310 [Kouleothrix aurantiaca]
MSQTEQESARRRLPLPGIEQLWAIMALALIGAQALERAQIYDQQQRSLLRLQVLRTIDQGILNSRPLETIVGSALDDLHMLVPYHHGRVARALFDEHPAQIIAAREWRLMERGTEARASASIDDMATVCFEQKPVTTADLAAATPRTRDIELLLAQGIRSRLAQPLIADGLYLGQLEVLSAQPAAFLEDHVQIVSEIAAQFAVVMRQVQLLGERERAEERFRLVVEASPSGLVMVDLAGQIALVNRAAEQMFGYSRAELLGQPVEMLVPPRFRSGHPALRHGFAGRPEARAMGAGRDLLGLRKDGSEFPVEIGLNPIEASDGLHFLTVIADITERRRAAEALLASERRFHQMIDSMLEGVQIIGFDWRYRYLNDGAVAHGRKPREELIGRTMMEVYPGIEHTAVFQMLQRCMEGREPARLENRYEYADGSSAWFELSVQPALEGIFVLSADVTERKQIEEAIRETELKLRSLVEILPVGVSILDDKSKVVYSNLALEHIIELPIELVSQGAHQARTYIRPDRSPMLRDEFASTRALREQRAVYNVETGIVKENGAVTWVSVNAAPVDFPNWRVAVVTSDITERKHAEAALQESEERFATAFQSSPAALAISRQRNSSFIDVNEAFCALLGYAREEVLGHTWQELDLFPDTAILAGIARDAREHGSVHQAEISIRTKDGGIRSVLFSTETVEANGEPCFLTLFFDVTERKIAQEALRKSEERFARAFHASPAAMLITRQSDGVFLDVNASYEELVEYRRDELIGKTGIGLDLYVSPGQRAEIIGLLHESGALSNHELLLRTKLGALRTVLCGLESIELDGVPCYLESLVDITERKHAEAALRESEQRFAKAFRASPAAITISRVRDSHFIDVNDRFCTLFGYGRDEVIERTMLDLALFPDLVALGEVRRAAQSRGTIRDAEIVMQTKDRKQLTMLFSVEQIEVNGEPCFLTLLFDVTERKQAEDALREREAQLHLLTETMPAVPWSATPAGNIDYFTQRWLDLTGLTHEQALSSGWQHIAHPDDAPVVASAWQHSLASGMPYEVIHRIRTAGGSYRWQRSRALPQRDAHGAIVRWHGITDDIHNLRMAEEALRESEARFRQLAESLPQLIWTCGSDGLCDYLSPQWVAYTGIPAAEQLGLGWLAQLHPDEREEVADAWQAALDSGSDWAHEFRIRRHDGEYRWFDTRGVRLKDTNGRTIKWFGSNTDIQEQREYQQTLNRYASQLQQLSHKLVEAQETERRRIAHELHDQIGQSLTGLKLSLDSTDTLPLAELSAQLGEARQVINELLGRVRTLSLDLRPSMLDDLGLLPALNWLIERYAAQTGVRVDWRHKGVERRFPTAIETSVYRIVQEALTNVARHAGVAVVELRLLADDERLLLQIADEGCGFNVEDARQSQQSVGLLGMHERVELVGGTIVVDSEPGQGTHVSIVFPLGSLEP